LESIIGFPQIIWLAMKSSRPREWTELEVKTLISMSGRRHSAEEISKSLGRYVGSVKTKARELGLVAVKKRSKARRFWWLLEMEERSRVEMAIIRQVTERGTCDCLRRQSTEWRRPRLISTGGSSATVAAAVRTAEIAMAPVLLSSSIPVVSPFLKIGTIHFDELTGEQGPPPPLNGFVIAVRATSSHGTMRRGFCFFPGESQLPGRTAGLLGLT